MANEKIKLMVPQVGERELDLIKEVFESGHLVEGDMVRRFEELVNEFSGSRHAIACTSATVGLELALKALNVGEGDEVIVPSFTHPASALAVMNVGATPVLVDVDLELLNMTPELAGTAVTRKTKAIMPVSWGGYPIDGKAFMDKFSSKGIAIIEDAACSLGTSVEGRKTGSTVDFTIYSFHPRKLIAMGDGGCVVTNRNEYAEKIKSLKHFGVRKINGKAEFVEVGGNYRMSNILGAVGVGQLERFSELLQDRAGKANLYKEFFRTFIDNGKISLSRILDGGVANYQSFCIYINEDGVRDKILSELRPNGIEVQIGTTALQQQVIFQGTKRVGTLDNSFKLANNLLTLPLHYKLSFEDQKRVVYEVAKYLK